MNIFIIAISSYIYILFRAYKAVLLVLLFYSQNFVVLKLKKYLISKSNPSPCFNLKHMFFYFSTFRSLFKRLKNILTSVHVG